MAKAKTQTKSKTTTKQESGAAVASKRSKEVRDKIKKACENLESNHLDLAQLLHEAFTREYASKWGFDDFEAFCTSELDVGYRKARYMVEIWAKVSERELDIKRLNKIGWSKLKEICSVMNDSYNIADDDLITLAESKPLRELTYEVKEIRKKAGNQRDPSQYKVSFVLSASANKAVAEALETAVGIQENEDKNLALEMICQDWLLEKGKVPEKQDIKDYIAFLEKTYGVTITVSGQSLDSEEKVDPVEDKPVGKKAVTKKTGKKKTDKKADSEKPKKKATSKNATPKEDATEDPEAEADLADLLAADDAAGDGDAPDGWVDDSEEKDDLDGLFDDEEEEEEGLVSLLGLEDD